MPPAPPPDGNPPLRLRLTAGPAGLFDGLADALRRLAAGAAADADVGTFAAGLAALLDPREVRGLADRPAAAVELVTDADPRVLCDLPWEMAAAVPPARLADRPLVRLVGGADPAAPPPARPRALLCVSNPTWYTGAAAFRPDDTAGRAVEVLGRLPRVELRVLGWDADREAPVPRADEVVEAVREFRPHLFVYVGHGRAGAADDPGARLLLADQHWPVAELARVLAETGHAAAAVLVACNLARTGAGPAGTAAAELVRRGVAHVVAMQGVVRADLSGAFLGAFLTALLRDADPARAAAAGRRAIHVAAPAAAAHFLPTVFASADRPSPLREFLGGGDALMAKLFRAPGLPTEGLPRPVVEEELRNELRDGRGLVSLTGPDGAGQTHVLGMALAAVAAGAGRAELRPVFYLDADRAEAAEPARVTLFRQLRAQLEEYRPLLPERVPAAFGEWNAASSIGEAAAVVVLDHLDVTAEPAEEQAFWKRFFEAAAALPTSLVVAVSHAPVGGREVTVGPLSEAECQEYAARYLGGRAVRDLRRRTGGLPLLLNLFRFGSGGRGRPAAKAGDYLGLLRANLSAAVFRALCRLCWLPRSTTWDLARALFADGDGGPLERLCQAGVVRRRAGAACDWCDVPPARARQVRERFPTDVAAAADHLVRRYHLRVDADPARHVPALARQPGGFPVLLAVQAAMLRRNDVTAAVALATHADAPGVARDANLWELFRTALAAARPADTACERLRAAEVAQEQLRSADAAELIEQVLGLRRRLDPFQTARLLYVRASLLRDTAQHAGADAALEALEEGITLARAGDASATRAAWDERLVSLLQKRVEVRVFLRDANAADPDVAADIAELLRVAGRGPAYAYLLATLAERELRQPPGGADWERLAGWLAEARLLMPPDADPRDRAYYAYQHAMYFARTTNPDPLSAYRLYREADGTAGRAGDPVRQGLARLRWVELGWLGLKEFSSRTAAEHLDELIPRVAAAVGARKTSAFAARTLALLRILRARVAAELPDEPEEGFLLAACRSAAAPVLASAGDNYRFGQALRRLLELRRRTRGGVGVQETLAEFAAEAKRRLDITIALDDPVPGVTELRQLYPG